MKIKALTGAVLALALGLGGLAFAGPALATGTECVASDETNVTVVDHEAVLAVAAIPEVTELSHIAYQRYSWNGGKTDTAPVETAPGDNWTANTTNYAGAGHGDDKVGVAFPKNDESGGDWFFWTGTKVIDRAHVAGIPAVAAVAAVTHIVHHDAVTCPPVETPPAECVASDAYTDTITDSPAILAVAAIPEVTELSHIAYQRYSWNGGKTDTAPVETAPGDNWTANTTNYAGAGHGDDKVGVAFPKNDESGGDWFFWTGTKVIDRAHVAGIPAVAAVAAVTHDVVHAAVTCTPVVNPPVIPEPTVVSGVAGVKDCETKKVTVTTTTVTSNIYHLNGLVLVHDADTVVSTIVSRDATVEECPAEVVVPPTSPIMVTPELPKFADAECTDSSASTTPSYTIPTKTGVQYQASSDGIKFTDVGEGQYMAAVGSKIWVKAVAKTGYVLSSFATFGPHEFIAAGECQLPERGLKTPATSSTPITCENAGSYTLVSDEGVIWLVDGKEKSAGTYDVSRTSTVGVVATTDPSQAGLEANAQTKWTFSFTKPNCELTTLALPGSNGTLASTGSNGTLASGLLLGLIFMIVGAGAMTVNHVRRRTN